MKKPEQQLRDELAAMKRALRRSQREDRRLKRRLVDLAHALGGLLDESDIAPSRRDYSTDRPLSDLVFDIEAKQWLLAWKASGLSTMKAEDKRANMLFEEADSEYVTIKGDFPGREYLIIYARAQVQRRGLPPRTEALLTDHRARRYVAHRNAMLDNGWMTLADFVDPYAYGDVAYIPDDHD